MDIIYKLTSPKGKVYIGRTNDFDRRMTEHKHAALVRRLPTALHRAIRKYGWDNIAKEVICEVEMEKAARLEEEFILAYDSVRKGYNNTYKGGEGGSVWEGRWDSDEYMEFCAKMKVVNTGENNGMFGKSHTEEAKALQKEKAKGRFSLPWYIERNGEEEGTRMYNERCYKLKNRVVDWRDPVTGDFKKRS